MIELAWRRALGWLTCQSGLERARRAVQELDPASVPAVELGLAAFRDAERLAASPGSEGLALLSYRAAARLFLRAGATPQGPTAEWLERFVQPDGGELEIARLLPAERRDLLRVAREWTSELGGLLHEATRGIRVWKARRRWRLLLATFPFVLLVAFALHAALSPRNWARGARVTTSDQWRKADLDPKGLVDGDQLAIGFHTGKTKDPWATIDLGQERRVSRIRIFNRRDCCGERSVPLIVELSRDGRRYVKVGRRRHSFFEWTLDLKKPALARYVRLERKGTEFFHLAEVEVY